MAPGMAVASAARAGQRACPRVEDFTVESNYKEPDRGVHWDDTFGLDRCWKGWPHFQTAMEGYVLTYNLVVLARLLL